MKRNGITTAHGRTWPMYERKAYTVEILGNVLPECAESLKAELLAIGERYGLTPKVRPLTVLFMLPEHQAEKNALDEAALTVSV